MKLLTLRVPALGLAPAVCAHRARYDTRREANHALGQARRANGVRPYVYYCPWCGGRHVGGAE